MNLHDELVHEMLRKEILEEVNALRLQREAARGKTLFDQGLALISRLVNLLGNQLCRRYKNVKPASFRISGQKC